MNTAKIPHVSHKAKDGYVWRKRYDNGSLYIALRTTLEQEAMQRGAAMTLRYLDLESLGVPYAAMYETLKKYRDELVKLDLVGRLQRIRDGHNHSTFTFNATGATQSAPVIQPTQHNTIHDLVAQEAIQRELAANVSHSLEETKKAFFNASTEWKPATIKDYSVNIDRFIVWAATQGISTVEGVTKSHIVDFKAYMDSAELAPNTKQKVLTRIGSMFNFAVDVKEWIAKNPVSGMQYKKVGNVTEKEEITHDQQAAALANPVTANNNQVYWAMNILFHTGMRVGELSQLTAADYREIDGVKCISINAENGKRVKNDASIRNIPLCDKLLELGIWDKKPVIKYGDNAIMAHVTKAFKTLGLKRSTHCYRHSLSNRLRDVPYIQDSVRFMILGHSQQAITDRVYISRAPLLKMKEALDAAN